jgi:branched-subunit amino acid transport protein
VVTLTDEGGLMTVWIAVLVTGLGCYGLKLAGLVVPQRVLSDARVRRFSELVPVALLTALVVVQSLADGRSLELNAPRLAGIAAAVVALLLRAPFLVVLLAAAAVTAGLRLMGA